MLKNKGTTRLIFHFSKGIRHLLAQGFPFERCWVQRNVRIGFGFAVYSVLAIKEYYDDYYRLHETFFKLHRSGCPNPLRKATGVGGLGLENS